MKRAAIAAPFTRAYQGNWNCLIACPNGLYQNRRLLALPTGTAAPARRSVDASLVARVAALLDFFLSNVLFDQLRIHMADEETHADIQAHVASFALVQEQ